MLKAVTKKEVSRPQRAGTRCEGTSCSSFGTSSRSVVLNWVAPRRVWWMRGRLRTGRAGSVAYGTARSRDC